MTSSLSLFIQLSDFQLSVVSVLNIEVERLCNTCTEALSFRVKGHRQVAQGVKRSHRGRCVVHRTVTIEGGKLKRVSREILWSQFIFKKYLEEPRLGCSQ